MEPNSLIIERRRLINQGERMNPAKKANINLNFFECAKEGK
jgi:hypothetical protein